MKQTREERLKGLEKQIADLKERWPAHSVPAAMMAQLDALEEALNRELHRGNRTDADADEAA